MDASGALPVVACYIGLQGCGQVVDQTCTLIGCTSGLQIYLVPQSAGARDPDGRVCG